MHFLLAMSGGVDSSVAASILLEKGYKLSGVYMRHGLQVHPADESDA
ncbi:MAG: tRNA 2-thiouridine(34) synthase MnmA, partial [Thermoguttaceae bacterium]